jgi:hypothetical protein
MASGTPKANPQVQEAGQPAEQYNERAKQIEAALGRLIELMNPYSNPECDPHTEHRMAYVNFHALPLSEPEPDRNLVAQFEVEVDNYEQDWTLRGQTYRVVRALRIPYRYEVRNRNGHHNGVWATEWLLIGYGGANGG